MAWLSLAQAPRSISLQRSEQKGRVGVFGLHSTGAPQVGQATVVLLMGYFRVGISRTDAVARLRLLASRDHDRCTVHRRLSAGAVRG